MVQPSEVNAKTEGTILLADKEDQDSMTGRGGMNESHGKMLVKEGMKGLKLRWEKGVGGAKGRRSSFFELYLQIMFTMWSKYVGFALAENISKLMVI